MWTSKQIVSVAQSVKKVCEAAEEGKLHISIDELNDGSLELTAKITGEEWSENIEVIIDKQGKPEMRTGRKR